jgi:hypothetical protein
MDEEKLNNFLSRSRHIWNVASRGAEEKLGPHWTAGFTTPSLERILPGGRAYLSLCHASGFFLVRISRRKLWDEHLNEKIIRKLRRQSRWLMLDHKGQHIASFGGAPDVACAQAVRIVITREAIIRELMRGTLLDISLGQTRQIIDTISTDELYIHAREAAAIGERGPTRMRSLRRLVIERWRESRRPWRCIDCGVDTGAIGHYYMVSNDLWASAGMQPDGGGMLCLDCLEKRIGRPLIYDDFTAIVPDAWGAHLARHQAR